MRNLLLIAMLLAAASGPVGTGAESADRSAPQAASPPGSAESDEDGPPPEEFLPSEQVRVDNEVSFPVDI